MMDRFGLPVVPTLGQPACKRPTRALTQLQAHQPDARESTSDLLLVPCMEKTQGKLVASGRTGAHWVRGSNVLSISRSHPGGGVSVSESVQKLLGNMRAALQERPVLELLRRFVGQRARTSKTYVL